MIFLVCNLDSIGFIPNGAFLPGYSSPVLNNRCNKQVETYYSQNGSALFGNSVQRRTLLGAKRRVQTGKTSVAKVSSPVNLMESLANNSSLSSNIAGLLPSINLKNLKDTANQFGILGLWYAGTVLYNIENKKALNMCPLPKTIATLQMYVAVPFLVSRWLLGLKSPPRFNVSTTEPKRTLNQSNDIISVIKRKVSSGLHRVKNYVKAYKSILVQSGYFSLLHVLSVTALNAGAVGFVHILKASEPIFASVVSYFMGSKMSPITFLTLVPIVGGVALSSIKELNFSPTALIASLLSNVFASVRRIEAKKFFKQNMSKIGQNITPSNVFTLMTLFSTIMLTPLALYEQPKWAEAYDIIVKKFGKDGPQMLMKHVVLSGIFYALYNEVSFIALSQLAPVSHAVANTFKRIFLILTSVAIFDAKLSSQGMYGSALAIFGTLLYSLSKTLNG
ncbi:conserved hypothetical protein [Theileria equi strain WA]|uniref:Sugar phosphate transporter domain-containing protein n=1 Tax=Theileria equi strain WA TaxID=1537102 RepID=L1LEK5_THEEQ|nr:conserved hypothetical protein [Theileria equi strain WA]EKX73714.1 conserved hypothetical protein [Theileria equi strain WA]|eukprot:XP_004833166.1 conserved hypothetical protein [Theileria equi strain WA]